MKKITSILTIIASLALLAPALASASGALSLSQTSVNLNAGQSTTVNVYASSGQVANITSISNSSVLNATTSNNVVSIYALNSGSSQVTLCTFDNSCGTINVTVNGYNNYNNNSYNNNYYYGNGSLNLSQTTVNLNVGQSSTISIYNPQGSTYVSNNSNSQVVQAYTTTNMLILNGLTYGTSTITVSDSNSNTATVYVSVGGANNNYNYNNNNNYNYNPSYTQSINVNLYQSTQVTLYGTGNNFYVMSNSNPNAVSATISGNTLTVYGTAAGSTTVTVGQYNGGQVSYFNVTVNNSYNNNYNTYSTLAFSNVSLTQPILNQYYSYQLLVIGGNSPYSFTMTSGSLPPGLYMSNTGLIYGTMTQALNSNFIVQATDNYGHQGSQNFGFTFNSQTSYNYNYGNVLGANVYNNGTLINDSGTIYLTYKNTKSGFGSLAAFQGLGYNLSNVISASTSGLNNSGYVIGTSSASHPWGSWIKSGSTIYFVDPNGLIPIPTYDIFTSNGGHDALVVNANAWDLARLVLPIMGYNDSRLR